MVNIKMESYENLEKELFDPFWVVYLLDVV